MNELGTLGTVAAWVAVVAAGVAGLVYLARIAGHAVRALSTMSQLVERELTPNHGSSIKDDVHGMALALGKLQREFTDHKAETRRRLTAIESNTQETP